MEKALALFRTQHKRQPFLTAMHQEEEEVMPEGQAAAGHGGIFKGPLTLLEAIAKAADIQGLS